MKRLLSIIMLIVCVLAKADAQYYSVNYDKQTVAAMAAAYGTEAVAEAYYNEQVQNILKHYNAWASGTVAQRTTITAVSTTWCRAKSCRRYGRWQE